MAELERDLLQHGDVDILHVQESAALLEPLDEVLVPVEHVPRRDPHDAVPPRPVDPRLAVVEAKIGEGLERNRHWFFVFHMLFLVAFRRHRLLLVLAGEEEVDELLPLGAVLRVLGEPFLDVLGDISDFPLCVPVAAEPVERLQLAQVHRHANSRHAGVGEDVARVLGLDAGGEQVLVLQGSGCHGGLVCRLRRRAVKGRRIALVDARWRDEPVHVVGIDLAIALAKLTETGQAMSDELVRHRPRPGHAERDCDELGDGHVPAPDAALRPLHGVSALRLVGARPGDLADERQGGVLLGYADDLY